jgi:hypothetical protein
MTERKYYLLTIQANFSKVIYLTFQTSAPVLAEKCLKMAY